MVDTKLRNGYKESHDGSADPDSCTESDTGSSRRDGESSVSSRNGSIGRPSAPHRAKESIDELDRASHDIIDEMEDYQDEDHRPTFEVMDHKIAASILNPSVRKVVQLCFAALATVFISAPNDEGKSKKGQKEGTTAPVMPNAASSKKDQESNGVQCALTKSRIAAVAEANRMAIVPMECAFLLWEELLSLNRGNKVNAALHEKLQKNHRYPGVAGFLKGSKAASVDNSASFGSKGEPQSFRPTLTPTGRGGDPDFGYDGSSDEEHDIFFNSDDEMVDTPLDGEDDGSLAAQSAASSTCPPPYTKYVSKAEFNEFVKEMSAIKSTRLWKRGGTSRASSSMFSDARSMSDTSSLRDDTSSQYSRSSKGTLSSPGSSHASRNAKRVSRRGPGAFMRRGGPPPSLIKLSKRVSDAAAATLGETRQTRIGQGGGDDRPSNIDLLCLIRDFLIDLGLITKVNGSVESFYVLSRENDDENKGNFPRMMDRFTKRKPPANHHIDGIAATSGPMSAAVERKKETEYGLRIDDSYNFLYGLRLAALFASSIESGTQSEQQWIGTDEEKTKPNSQDAYWNSPNDQATEKVSASSGIECDFDFDEESFADVTLYMSSAMAEACLEKGKRNKEKLFDSMKDRFKNMKGVPQQDQSKNDLDSYGDRFFFSCGLVADSQTLLVDDATVHALRMLPSYLIRSSRSVEAATLLSCTGFARGRILILGVEEGTRWQRQDCAKLQGSDLQGSSIKDIDEKGATIAAYNTMMTSLLERENSLGVTSRSFVAASKHLTVVQKTVSSEVGKAFHSMGLSASKQGFLKLSLECYKEALNSKRAVLGRDDVSVAASLHNMGNVYLSKGWYQQATDCYEEVLRVQKLKLGAKHKKVCATLHSLGTVYGMTGTYQKAIQSYHEALISEKLRYGDDQLPVAKTLNSIGIIHGMNGCYSDAVICYREALRIKRVTLGFNDEEVASTLYNLGIVQSKNGEYKAAMLSYKEALRIRRILVGDHREDIARILHYIGTVHADLGDYDDAIVCYMESLGIRKSILGVDHEDVARTLHNLGLAYDQNDDDELAMKYFEEALEIARKNFGCDHEKVADTLHRIGVVCNKTGKYEQASDFYENALRIRKMKLGDEHLDSAATYHNLGDVHYVMNAYDQAMECYEKALQVRRTKLGNDHVDVAATLNNMGVVFLRRGQNNYAIDCYKEALKVRKSKLGDMHEKVADTLHNIGLVHKNIAEHDLAMSNYKEALKVRKLTLGDKHSKVADTLYNMGIVYSNSGQYEEALACYEGALKTYEGADVEIDHPSVINTMDWITWIKRQLETPLG